MRPLGEVADHVARLAGLGYRKLYFVDNSFNIPEPYALDLCGLLRLPGPTSDGAASSPRRGSGRS